MIDPDSDRHTGPDKQLAEHAIQLDYLHQLTDLLESQLKYVNSDLDWLIDTVKRIERDIQHSRRMRLGSKEEQE